MATSDDIKLLNQIYSIHSLDASQIDDKIDLLSIVEDILRHATPTPILHPKTYAEALTDKAHHQQGISEALALTIHKIGCEISCNCSAEGDVKAITLAVFKTLEKCSWDAKVTLALSAFAVSYGEFCLISQLHAIYPMAKSVVLLKPLPDISERAWIISSLLKVVMKVSKCIYELMHFDSKYISCNKPPLSHAMNHIRTAVYWAIKSIIACASQSTSLLNTGHECLPSIAEARKKFQVLEEQLNLLWSQLTKHLARCKKYDDDCSIDAAFYDLKHLMESEHENNMAVLSALILTEDSLPLFDCANKTRVSLEELRGKTVMLFTSYHDISYQEINYISQMGKTAERQYEMVWLPIINGAMKSTKITNEIEQKAKLMSCYSLHSSLSLQRHVIKYIRDVWHFENKPLMVVFNQQGMIQCHNAYHMMMIWGSIAFPFDTEREEALWNETTWNIYNLVHRNDSSKESFICLYGGGEIDWIKDFTSAMKEIAELAGITLEMIYIGKKHTQTITEMKIGTCSEKIDWFKAYLESMLYSKMQLNQSIANDPIMKDVMMFLSCDSSGQGWTMIGQGSTNMVTVNGKIMIDCYLHIKNNKVNIKENFFGKLNEVIKEVLPSKHCNHLILPNTNGLTQDNVVCVYCNSPMTKYIMYKCCNE